MKSSTKCLVLILLCLVSFGTSLKCYHHTCNFPNCKLEDEPREHHLRTIEECNPNAVCGVTRPMKFSGPIFRGCSDESNYCDTHHPIGTTCYTCKEDFCNDV